jgi:hypothetical protein
LVGKDVTRRIFTLSYSPQSASAPEERPPIAAIAISTKKKARILEQPFRRKLAQRAYFGALICLDCDRQIERIRRKK